MNRLLELLLKSVAEIYYRNKSWRRQLGTRPHTRRDISKLQLSVSKWCLIILVPLLGASYLFSDSYTPLVIPFCIGGGMSLLVGTANRLYSIKFEDDKYMTENKMKQLAQKALKQRDENPEAMYDNFGGELKEYIDYEEQEITRVKFFRDKNVDTTNDEDIKPQPKDRVAFYNSKGELAYEVYREQLDMERIKMKSVEQGEE